MSTKLKPRLTVLDLFCGAGGTSEGLVNAGLNVIAGIDTAIETYKLNHSHLGICADLTLLPPETFVGQKHMRYTLLIWYIPMYNIHYCWCS